MKALSIRQPWCFAILRCGKDIENRDWKPANTGLRFRGEFLIHASKGMTYREYADFYNDWHNPESWMRHCDGKSSSGGLPAYEKLDRGGIVGRARIVDVVREHSSPWFFGPVGLVLADVEPLPFVPLKGALGFFDVPDELVRKAA